MSERAGPQTSQAAKKHLMNKIDRRKYDPDQPMAERRLLRKAMRDHDLKLQGRSIAAWETIRANLTTTDNRHEFMAPESTGLHNMLLEQQRMFDQCKQTGDATMDGRFLVRVGDMAVKRAAQMQLGGAAAGVNVDDFVGKSMTFMRRGPSEADAARIYPPDSTQRTRERGPRRGGGADSDNDSDIEGIDDGDAMNWEWMGRRCAFPNNVRPPVPVFLLGPLSVQKKFRKVTQRVARQRLNPEDAVRPDELKLDEIERNENANLTHLCQKILELLQKSNEESCAAAQAEVDDLDEPTDEDVAAILEKHGVGDDGGSLLHRFAFNPKSFGQTVENLFYISFLIRDSRIGLDTDGNGLQTLHPSQPTTAGQRSEAEVTKNQGVFHLDFDIWEESIKLFNITECTIPHREDSTGQPTGNGWYG